MELERLTCGNCGATLDVPDGVEFVTCRHCGSSLNVRRTESVAFTQVMQTLKEQSDRILDNTEVLRIQNQIALLDQEWEQRSHSLMIRGKHGHVSAPGKISSIVGAFMITIFGTFWTVLASNAGAPIAGIGVFMTGAGIVMCVVNFAKAHKYQQLREDHEQKRAELNRGLSRPAKNAGPRD